MSFYLFSRYFLSGKSNSLIRLISWLCLAGVAVSIAALLLIVSVMGGLGDAVKSRLLDKQAHLRIQYDKNPFSKSEALLDRKNLLFDSKILPDFLSQLLNAEQKQGILSVQNFETQELILKSRTGFKGVSAKGYRFIAWQELKQSAFIEERPFDTRLLEDTSLLKEETPTQEPQALREYPESGSEKEESNKIAGIKTESLSKAEPSLLSPTASEAGTNKEVLISYNLALETGLFQGDDVIFVPIMGLFLPPGVPPPAKIFKVAGMLDKDSTTSIYYQQGAMDFGDFSKADYQSEVRLKKPEQVLQYQSLFKQHKLKNWMEENSHLFFALKLEKFIMTLFFIISLLISCLGISSALLLLMTQKAEDIAILQAIGMSQAETVKSWTKIGWYLSNLGLLIGAGLGLSMVLFLKYNRWNILPAMYQDRSIPANFLPLDYTVILLGACLASYIFCYLPSYYFSRVNVIALLKRSYF